jgi:hypothetical protein
MPDKEHLDPLYRHSRRETIVIIVLFAIFCAWSVAVYYFMGLQADPGQPVSITFGMPSWVFYGLLLPWILVDVVAVWFCFFYMKDDDLGIAHEGEDLEEQVEHLHEREAHDE